MFATACMPTMILIFGEDLAWGAGEGEGASPHRLTMNEKKMMGKKNKQDEEYDPATKI